MKQLKVCVLLVFILGLFSCGNKSTQSDKKVFRYNEVSTISSLDPAFASMLSNTWAVQQLYNTPLSFNEKMEIEPCLANSWSISLNNLVICDLIEI